MFCTKCGKEVDITNKFCASCGTSINDDTIKADVKVEVTNATAEKAFKAVGNTISSGKQAVTARAKTTTSIVKKYIPIVAFIVATFLLACLILWVNPENLWDFIFQGHNLRDYSTGEIIKKGWSTRY
jgi:uncharacterized membrane protein YvbJ